MTRSILVYPQGDYNGVVQGRGGAFLGRFWTGKVFTGSTVINKIAGRRMITGQVSVGEGVVFIDYPQLGGLRDVLTPADDRGDKWDGEMRLGLRTIRFTLTRR